MVQFANRLRICYFWHMNSLESDSLIVAQRESDVVDQYTPLQSHGDARLGRLCRHGRLWFVKTSLAAAAGVSQGVERLRKEYELMIELSHPGVARAMWMEDIPQVGPSIVMELIDGETLDAFLVHATRSERRMAARQLVEAMAYVHSHRVCHLDLKPENIMVTGSGASLQIKVIDFGLADAPGLLIAKNVGGNKLFGAPEQWHKDYVAMPSADVYSLGCLLKMFRIGLPPGVIKRATANDPAQRPADAAQLLTLIKRAGKMRAVTYVLAAMAVVVGVAIFAFICQPKRAVPQKEAITFSDTVKQPSPAGDFVTQPNQVKEAQTEAKIKEVPHKEASRYVAMHDSLIGVLTPTLRQTLNSMRAIAADSTINLKKRSSKASQIWLAANADVITRFYELERTIPEDKRSDVCVNWGSAADPSLAWWHKESMAILESLRSN